MSSPPLSVLYSSPSAEFSCAESPSTESPSAESSSAESSKPSPSAEASSAEPSPSTEAGGEEDATMTTTAKCDGDGGFVIVSLSSDVCRKDDRPAGKAPRVRRRTTMEMNDNNKDDDHGRFRHD